MRRSRARIVRETKAFSQAHHGLRVSLAGTPVEFLENSALPALPHCDSRDEIKRPAPRSEIDVSGPARSRFGVVRAHDRQLFVLLRPGVRFLEDFLDIRLVAHADEGPQLQLAF